MAAVNLARQGDEAAARTLVERLYPLVLRIVRAHLPRRASEEDLVQTVYLKVFGKLHQFSGQVPLEHWVSRIAVNTCLTELGRERARPELRWADLSEEEEGALAAAIKSEEASDPAQAAGARELVETLLALLSPRDRVLLSLMYLQGHSIEEIRQMTGWSVPGIKVRAFRARALLKKHLGKLLKEPTYDFDR
jgi:RNA polymerase sigma-70 factor (ECF subfamily)